MIEKKLVFDVVFITENDKVFELRSNHLSKNIDYTLLFGSEENLSKIKKFCVLGDEKTFTFVLPNGSLDFEFISNSILDTIQKLYKSFEDLVLFSHSDEIPDLDSIEEIVIKSTNCNFLVCDVYEGDFNRKRKYTEVGPVLMNFSHIVKHKKEFLSHFLNPKFKWFHDLVIKNGFKIINYETNLSNLHSTYTCPYSNKNVEYKNESTNRKFVFLLDTSFQDFTADFIFEIQFVNNFPEDLKIDFDKKHQKLKLFLPKKTMYTENYDDFSITYKTQEIKRILSLFNCQLEDDIEIHYENNEIKKYKFQEIKNPSF